MASTSQGGGSDRVVDKGHGTSALGPSDTSDTGSDITGAPGTIEGDVHRRRSLRPRWRRLTTAMRRKMTLYGTPR
jgi:hypothetical protein